MQGFRSSFSRSGGFNPDSLGHDAIRLVGNLCFALFVVGVLVFTIIAATYQPEDPLLRPSTKITTFLTSTSNATFSSDLTAARTGEDFISASNATIDEIPFINLTAIVEASSEPGRKAVTLDEVTGRESAAESVTEPKTNGDEGITTECDLTAPIDCTAQEVFQTMMRATIEQFNDVRFYRFGKPVRGDSETSCDMAWRFRPKDAKRAAFYKDYRRFQISRGPNCTYTVTDIGNYHTGVNARKKKKKKGAKGDDVGFELKHTVSSASLPAMIVPVVGETVNDSLPVVESESSFSTGKYLHYTGGGDRCKSMDQYLWSFLCALGEAQYLNRTLVMDLSICLSSTYTNTNQNEEGKDFRFYFDFEHLKESASVLDQREFWTDWDKWQKKDGLRLHLVEDFRITPMQLASVKDALIMRKFGSVEPDNYWYRVCEGETESVIQRPWHLLWKSRRLLDIVSGIASKMNWDFDSVHIVRGEKARNTQLWPNLAADTSPDALLSTLKYKIDDGRNVYIATNEPDTSFFNPLKDKYNTRFLDDFNELWGENSEWYAENKQLNNGVPVEFDGYMRVEVDTEVFLRGKKQIETFNDLTSDCKDGVNTCKAAS